MLESISWKTSKTFSKYILLPVVLILMIAAIKYRGGNINYYNSDATWHALLTIEAYEETPISVHKFLPIVTLGDIDDKWITWGATIPDQYGNYYYTSFSPAGYVLPWLFMKIFHLPISEASLYIFNSLLFMISGILWMTFIKQIYEREKYVFTIGLAALLTYALAPEVLHGMGIVYWHQSIMQVTLLLQVIAFYNMRDSKRFKILFYSMALLNPYIEWTGYVANVGFAIAEIILYRHDWKLAIKKAFLIGIITICSFGLFTCHYLLVVEPVAFFNALKNRFMARNITTSVSASALVSGYIKSFLYLWGLLGILLLLNLLINKRIQIRHGIILFVLFFPVLENLIMKQHALSYSYDRMKLIFPLSFLICELMAQLLENVESSYIWKAAVIGLSAVGGVLNLNSYVTDTHYVYEAEYRSDNVVLAQYIEDNYSNSIITIPNSAVRGYVNLLFERGIYEWKSADTLTAKAEETGKRYVIELIVDDSKSGNVYKFGGARIYDLEADMNWGIVINNGEILMTENE